MVHPKPHLAAGHRSPIAFMISSAHRIASAIALIVAGTLSPPVKLSEFAGSEDSCRNQEHTFTALVHGASVAVSLFVRLKNLHKRKSHLWFTPVAFPFSTYLEVLRQSLAACKAL